MTGFTFHILKLNTIAALIICAACIVSRLTRKKYTCKWKYLVWLVTALALLVPVDLSPFSRVQLQIVQPTRQTGMRQNFEDAPSFSAVSAASGTSSESGTSAAPGLVLFPALAPAFPVRLPAAFFLHLADRLCPARSFSDPQISVFSLVFAPLELSGSEFGRDPSLPQHLPP